MNREGIALLRALIDRTAAMNKAAEIGDCTAIAFEVNLWMPPDLQVTPADVYTAINGRKTEPKMNAEILRARIDAMPVLTSARLSTGPGALQAILNEVHLDPEFAGISLADVKAAMDVRVVPKPNKVAVGTAALVGKSRIG